MIITFDPKINSASSTDATYINFLRCITAAATAAAGTTTLTVNPYTASNVIDTTKNCIISIDANTEAGGWTTSASHNVPSSGNNTATTFTAVNSNGAYTTNYKADFYINSGKSVNPYLKLAFHIPISTTYAPDNQAGRTYPGSFPSYPYVQSTFGHSTTTDWTDTNWVAADASWYPQNPSSFTPFKDVPIRQSGNYLSISNPWRMDYSNGYVIYKIAITANYCIVWEVYPGSSYSTNYGSQISTADYNYYQRYGSIVYHGLRETQGWENTFNDNPPWVSWGYLHSAVNRTSGSTYYWYPTNCVGAWMRTQTNAGLINSPGVRAVYNSHSQAYTTDSRVGALDNNQLAMPLFRSRNSDGPYAGSTASILNPPQADPVTGLQVPGAYPIIIRSTNSDAFNAGGACRGIYKSLSAPLATMKNYWTAANQKFNINGEPYIPVVMNEDMWLIRAA